MPKGTWTKKDERMYKHIKATELAGGEKAKVATRIAAATVNQTRSERKREGKPKGHRPPRT